MLFWFMVQVSKDLFLLLEQQFIFFIPSVYWVICHVEEFLKGRIYPFLKLTVLHYIMLVF